MWNIMFLRGSAVWGREEQPSQVVVGRGEVCKGQVWAETEGWLWGEEEGETGLYYALKGELERTHLYFRNDSPIKHQERKQPGTCRFCHNLPSQETLPARKRLRELTHKTRLTTIWSTLENEDWVFFQNLLFWKLTWRQQIDGLGIRIRTMDNHVAI